MLTHSDALRLLAIGLPSPETCLVLTVLVCMAAVVAAVLIIAAFLGRSD